MNLLEILGSLHCHRFLEFLSIKLLWGHHHLFTSEIFDTEANPTELDGVKLLDLVVELSVRVLERSDDEPKSVN